MAVEFASRDIDSVSRDETAVVAVLWEEIE
jgi:hypothetical protein